MLQTATPATLPASLFTVRDTAKLLNVSESFVRRHVSELPAVRLGRLVRFDAQLLNQKFSGKVSADSGESLGKEPVLPIQRRYQEGGVYKRGSVWYGTFRVDTMNTAGTLERKRRNVRLGEFPTKSAARKELQKHLPLSSKPSVDMTLSDLFEKWRAVKVPTLKTSTANYYVRSLNSRILPILGTTEITKLGRYEIELFLAAKSKLYTQNTLRELRSSLSVVLQWAVNCKWLESNPCLDANGRGIPLPKGTGRTITRNVLTPQQVKAIASKLKEPYATLILFLAVTGLRVGEAVGVQWDDFQVKRKGKKIKDATLHVQRRIYEGKADTLKTKKSKRYLPIPAWLMARLETLDHSGQWVFISENGTPVNYNNALKRYVRPVAEELGIVLGGWHDLRHTLATDLIVKDGVPTKTVSSILGHTNSSTTENVYTHPDTESFRKPLNERAAQFVM